MKLESIPADLYEKIVNTVRFLAIDQVEAAKSGHPGLPMGAAELVLSMYCGSMRFNPADPRWQGRDRFVLSPGHGSALQYALLHLLGYGLTMDELKAFRQLGSRTPGHPEVGLTPGVETTTGPLGAGMAMSVGMAIAGKHLDARINSESFRPFDYKIYALVSDGDLMEGVSSEAGSLAGHLKLDNLICVYDSNSISIEGSTDLAFTENVAMRFRAFGWAVTEIDGHDRQEIAIALRDARQSDRPVLILAKTIIGKGSPKKAGTADCHGAPLGPDETKATRNALKWPYEPFTVPQEVTEFFTVHAERLQADWEQWREEFGNLLDTSSEAYRVWSAMDSGYPPDDLEQQLLDVVASEKSLATRVASGKIMQKIAQLMPGFIGGSADLAPSNMTHLKDYDDLSHDCYEGRNIHFGVREHAMGSIMNGLALSKLLIPFGATFLVFADYMRPAIRLAALQELRTIFVFTHDSFHLGEDGPTHQPIEHLTMLRATPDVLVLRPADARETALCWAIAIRRMHKPTVLALTRQKLPTLDPVAHPVLHVTRGAYLLHEPRVRDVTLLASGSEVPLAVDAAKLLSASGVQAAVVSMPSEQLFLEQDHVYRAKVLGDAPRVTIEAGSSFGKDRIAPGGLFISLNQFGASAPAEKLAEFFGFTPEAVRDSVLKYLKR